MLDRLRAAFPVAIAVALPLAGMVLAGAAMAAGDRVQALRLAAATLLGVALYALLLTG
jgi:hypothetical protein